MFDADAGGGLLEEHLAPLTRRLEQLGKNQRLNLGEAASRLRFPAIAARPAGANFGAVCAATLQRRKLWIEYHARSREPLELVMDILRHGSGVAVVAPPELLKAVRKELAEALIAYA